MVYYVVFYIVFYSIYCIERILYFIQCTVFNIVFPYMHSVDEMSDMIFVLCLYSTVQQYIYSTVCGVCYRSQCRVIGPLVI